MAKRRAKRDGDKAEGITLPAESMPELIALYQKMLAMTAEAEKEGDSFQLHADITGEDFMHLLKSWLKHTGTDGARKEELGPTPDFLILDIPVPGSDTLLPYPYPPCSSLRMTGNTSTLLRPMRDLSGLMPWKKTAILA